MSEHYELIRKSSSYRNFLMLEEMRAEMQPPLGDKVPLDPAPSPICPEWSRRQWAIVLQLKSQQEGFIRRFYEGLNEIKQKSTPKEEQEDYL